MQHLKYDIYCILHVNNKNMYIKLKTAPEMCISYILKLIKFDVYFTTQWVEIYSSIYLTISERQMKFILFEIWWITNLQY